MVIVACNYAQANVSFLALSKDSGDVTHCNELVDFEPGLFLLIFPG